MGIFEELERRITDLERIVNTYGADAGTWLTASGAARHARMRRETIVAALYSGQLKGVNMSGGRRGRWRVYLLDLEEWMGQQQVRLATA